jgi:glycine/serine hydroxymethyltransferase
MAKYSQGEWKFVQTYYGCEVWAGKRLAFAYERQPDAENLANARLMANAKNLLEALEKCVNNPYRVGTPNHEVILMAARVAILEAKGESI